MRTAFGQALTSARIAAGRSQEIPARRRCIEFARSLDGLGVTSNQDGYLDLIAAGEERQRALEMGAMSGCALVVRGMWRRLGVHHPILRAPYRTGRAVADLVEIAAASHALVEVRERLPALHEGDVVIVGGGPEYGGPEHVWTALDVTAQGYPDETTALIRGLDGGQRDEHGRQAIRVVQHEISGVPPRDSGRRVRWVIDFGVVWCRWGQEAT
ncbi:hypothetical protein WMF31_08765 [Sorangium sp. So ce1036]|uniref:hypothetical protein n=1 Tax=Sorangium sp. So ce1036 TaxID=3133328 RepID=UPI003F044ECD